MKKILLFASAILLLAACDKEETDPQTLNEKIIRTWQIDKYYGGGVDSTGWFQYPFGGYTIEIRSGGSYTERYTPVFNPQKVVNGTWEFLNNGDYFKQVDSSQTRVFTVLEIEADYLKLKTPTKDQEFWLKPKP